MKRTIVDCITKYKANGRKNNVTHVPYLNHAFCNFGCHVLSFPIKRLNLDVKNRIAKICIQIPQRFRKII